MPATFDRATIQELQDALGYDDASMAEFVEEFYDDTAGLIAQIDDAYASSKMDSLRGLAHTLKSTTRTFGANVLAEMAEKLERLDADNQGGIGELVAQIAGEFQRLKTDLSAFYS